MKDKIPFYDIVNKFFVGTVFSILFVLVTFDKINYSEIYNKYANTLKDWSTLVFVVLLVSMYEIGLIINRMSSITIGPLLETTKIWPRDAYRIDVSELKKDNETFNSMITELVLIRSHVFLFLVLCVVSLVCKKWLVAIALLLVIIVFIASGSKHNKRISIIRKDYAERIEKEQKDET